MGIYLAQAHAGVWHRLSTCCTTSEQEVHLISLWQLMDVYGSTIQNGCKPSTFATETPLGSMAMRTEFFLGSSMLSGSDLISAVKVMGTIASQLKALSQNTPQSSIVL